MRKHGLPTTDKPHDKYFKAVFSIRELAVELLELVLPPKLLELLDVQSLTLALGSFVDEQLKESFSDLVYLARLKNDQTVCISFLFEHKSYPPAQPVQLQLLRYLVNSWETDLRQNRGLTPVIPIVIYQGKASWEKETFAMQFEQLPEAYLPYLPEFDFLFLSLREISDEVLFSLNLGLLQNVLLTMKHAREDEYLRHHFAQIVIFAEPIEQNELVRFIFEMTLLYLQSVSTIPKNEFKAMVTEQLPPDLKKQALTTFEQFLLEGEERGIAKGIEQGIEQGQRNMVLAVLQKHPDWADQQVADLLDVTTDFVKQIRAELEKI